MDTMSWRRFRLLLRNLSPYGAVANRISEAKADPTPEDKKAQAEGFFNSMFIYGKD